MEPDLHFGFCSIFPLLDVIGIQCLVTQARGLTRVAVDPVVQLKANGMPTLFFSRLIRVARLEAGIYAELKDDKAATWQAVMVVIAVAVAHAILGVFYATRGHWNVIRSIIPSLQSEIIFWFIWATAMYVIGKRFLGASVTYGGVLRALGFAALPGVLYALGFLSEAILWISWLWRIATIVIATRQLFGLGLAKSMALVAVGGVVMLPIVGATTLTTLQVLDWMGIR